MLYYTMHAIQSIEIVNWPNKSLMELYLPINLLKHIIHIIQRQEIAF